MPAHELTHNIGGVQQGAPHATVNGHCYDDNDLMCYDDGSGVPVLQMCGSAQEDLLDCNKDDYFNTNPAPGTFLADNWNTASSSFLDVVPVLVSPPDVTLGSSSPAAQTGDTVTFTASSTKDVTWTWATTSGCAVTPAEGTATMVCPSTVTGDVAVTATASRATDGTSASVTHSVAITKAAAPTVHLTAPTSATTGTAVPVSATVAGKSEFSYAWVAGSCTRPTRPPRRRRSTTHRHRLAEPPGVGDRHPGRRADRRRHRLRRRDRSRGHLVERPKAPRT